MPSNVKTEFSATFQLLLITFVTAALGALLDMMAIPCAKRAEEVNEYGDRPCIQYANKPGDSTWAVRIIFILLPSMLMITAFSQLYSLRNKESDNVSEEDACNACCPCCPPDDDIKKEAIITSSISYTLTSLLYSALTITGLILSDRTMPEGNQREELGLPRFLRTGLVMCVAMLLTYGINRTGNALIRCSTQRWRRGRHERLLDEALALTEQGKKSYGTTDKPEPLSLRR